jgi:hypothetical protein
VGGRQSAREASYSGESLGVDQQFSEDDVVNMTGATAVEYRGTGSFG